MLSDKAKVVSPFIEIEDIVLTKGYTQTNTYLCSSDCLKTEFYHTKTEFLKSTMYMCKIVCLKSMRKKRLTM